MRDKVKEVFGQISESIHTHGELGINGAVHATEIAVGRPIRIKSSRLPGPIFAQTLFAPDHFQIEIDELRPGSSDFIVAHELGHIALGHSGIPLEAHAHAATTHVSKDLIRLMLLRSCSVDHDEQLVRQEIEAEKFATLLVSWLIEQSEFADGDPASGRLRQAFG